MNFIRKNLSNIIFFGFVIFLFTPYGLTVRALMVRGLSMVTTQIFSLELDQKEIKSVTFNNWELVDINGDRVKVEDFENKVVVVNFWATWCPPCIAEMPSFQKLYDSYKEEVVFLFVANDDKQKVSDFLRKSDYDLPVYFEISNRPLEMNSNSLPTTYIINKNGELVLNKTGAVDWNSSRVRNFLDGILK